MAGNSWGTLFSVTTWGESHGVSVGGIIDGCPSEIELDVDFINRECARRAPGQSRLTTPRKETDQVTLLSGVHQGRSTGTPIAFSIENSNVKSTDYDNLATLFRPGHADFPYHHKYGFRDHRGGGRSSARSTAAIVAAGAIAQLVLKKLIPNLKINAFVKSVGHVHAIVDNELINRNAIDASMVRCPDKEASEKMIALIDEVRANKDSIGGVVECVVEHMPVGLGEPLHGKLDAELAKAMLSINAAKAFELGGGFESCSLRGSEYNDEFCMVDSLVRTKTNNCGGVLGGLSNGMPLVFRVGFKPTPTIGLPQKTVDINGENIAYEAKGRHDPCVLPRAAVIVEAMTALLLCDLALLDRARKGIGHE